MITIFLALLLTFSILHPHTTVAQPQRTNPAVCEYQKKPKFPINPQTNKPYMPYERNQEPFDGGSISKDEIRQCLQAGTPIKNHHIIFDDYWQAWASLAKETGDYAIPLRIEGGVLHPPAYDAEANTGGIDLSNFRDPNVSKGSDLTEEERKAFRIEKQKTPIALIRSPISWNSVFIDSALIPYMQHRQSTNEVTAIIFSAGADFSESTFNSEAIFSNSTFNSEAIFSNSTFNSGTDFSNSTFNSISNFSFCHFNKEATFSNSTFNSKAIFHASIFNSATDFSNSTFNSATDFSNSTFNSAINFSESTFNLAANFSESTFNLAANFSNSTFNSATNFSESTFKALVGFSESIFNAGTNFYKSIFNAEADFSYVRFKDNSDFRGIQVNSGQLIFNNTAWEKRIDLRGMSVKDLQWDSTDNPSDVKGTVDFRDAQIGSATVKEVRFQGMVDFSRMTVGKYGERIDDSPTKAQREEQQVVWASQPLMHFENNTFENEADFIHIKLHVPLRLIRNRFRRTLDLTSIKFETKKTRLCLSFNLINRLVFNPKHLGHPSGSPYQQYVSLVTKPLYMSRVRHIDAPQCKLPTQTNNNSQDTTQDAEPLDDIYKALGKSFQEANDREGINESWYLQILSKRRNASRICTALSWLFGDLPSRYTVDVWRAIWVSVGIMLCFYWVYFIKFGGVWRLRELWYYFLYIINECPRKGIHYASHEDYREKKIEGKIQIPMPPKYPEKYKAFRFRLFESIHTKEHQTERSVNPWTDSALLSMRSFLKLGLGSTYPDNKCLQCLTGFEWLLGVIMLIHFIWALKNNLPFILPFLGVVN